MQDSIESELIAAHLAPFAKDEGAWIDAYVAARSRAEPTLDAAAADRAARKAWQSHGWAHPAVVARLEHLLGALGPD
jgi:hypothetical protein